jgi:hypothetical protein
MMGTEFGGSRVNAMSLVDVGNMSEEKYRERVARLDWWINNCPWVAGVTAVIWFAVILALPK